MHLMEADRLFARSFEELEPGLGFETRGRTITESDLVSFSALTGDWHPQHADAEWAAESRFGERIAHGMLVLSYAVGLAPLDPSRIVALRGLERVTFKRPVRIGDTIRLRGTVAEISPLDGETALVRLAWEIVNQDDRAVARAAVSVVWRGGGAGSSNGEPATEELERLRP